MSSASTFGFSDAAVYIDKVVRDGRKHLTDSAVFGIKAGEELSTVYEECRVTNWDGFNAIPVSPDTMRQAYIFLGSLPLGFPVPTVGADPDGDITFEWYKSPRRTVSISVDMDGDLHYVALIGSSQHHGSMPFVGGIPATIQSLVRQVHS